MEIVTTLVKFRCRKDVMMEQSKNAQIFFMILRHEKESASFQAKKRIIYAQSTQVKGFDIPNQTE